MINASIDAITTTIHPSPNPGKSQPGTICHAPSQPNSQGRIRIRNHHQVVVITSVLVRKKPRLRQGLLSIHLDYRPSRPRAANIADMPIIEHVEEQEEAVEMLAEF